MSHPSLLEADLSQLFSQLSADLAQAQSMDEAAARCARAASCLVGCMLIGRSGAQKALR